MKFKGILALLLVIAVVNSMITTANAETIFGLARNLASAGGITEDTENRENTADFMPEPYNDTEFDPYIYMADNILSGSTPAGKSFNFYSNEADTIADIFKGSVTPEFEDYVEVWEKTNLALKPEDIPQKAIDAKGYYMTIILSMIQEAYTTDEINTKLVNSNFEQVSKLYISFTELYRAKCNCDLAETINQLGFTDEQKINYRHVAEDFLNLNGFVFAADTLNTFLDLCDVCQKPLEYIKKLFEYCSLYTATAEWKECLQLMYNKVPKSNIPLHSALDALLTASKGWDGIVLQIWRDGADEISAETHKLLIETLISAIADACPLIKGMRIGASIGKGISNLLFSVDKIIEEYYVVCAFCEVEDLFKSVFRDVTIQYKNNKNSSNAEKFLKYLEMYFKVLNTGNDFGVDFGKQLCDGSIASKIAYSKEAYQSFLKRAESMSRATNEAYDRIIRLWLLDLFDENPEQYEIYAVEFGDPGKTYLPVSSVKFEQSSVEWGLKDNIFNGYQAQAYPENASNRELTYTTSNKNVAEITPNGYLEVRGLGKCTITATSVDNDSVFDTLDVTVIELSGANSTGITDVFVNTVPLSSKYDFEYYGNGDGTTSVVGYNGTATAITIPSSSMYGETVTSVGGVHWYGRWGGMTSVTIPESVTSIDFSGCSSLETVTIPNSVTEIGRNAFKGCTSLTNVTIPDSVTSIADYAFYECTSLTTMIIPESVTSIGESAFCRCSSLNSITIPNSITSIGDFVFHSCSSLTSVTIPKGITSIGMYAFANCSRLSTVEIPESVTNIEDFAFVNCSNLASLTIPEGTTDIWYGAFDSCKSLTSVTIPKSVTNIAYCAFTNCTALNDVYYLGSKEDWDAILIDYSYQGNNALKNATIHFNGNSQIGASVEFKIPTPETGAPEITNLQAQTTINGETLTFPIDANGNLDLSGVSDGSYTFTFSAKNCAPRSYDVTVSDGAVSGLADGVELHLYGDIDGDGKVNMKDVGKANAHAKNTAKLSGYDLSVSDINGDGKINMQDVGLMNAHAKNTKSLW